VVSFPPVFPPRPYTPLSSPIRSPYQINDLIWWQRKLPSETVYDTLPVVFVYVTFGGSPAPFRQTLVEVNPTRIFETPSRPTSLHKSIPLPYGVTSWIPAVWAHSCQRQYLRMGLCKNCGQEVCNALCSCVHGISWFLRRCSNCLVPNTGFLPCSPDTCDCWLRNCCLGRTVFEAVSLSVRHAC